MKIKSIGIPLPIENIDTDQIIPAPYLKLTTKKGYGKFLFYNWRYLEGFVPNPEFVLNNEKYQNAKIIIAGNNFGCGSSREHAAWAIADYGIQAVISTQIADIHKENEYNSKILPIELTKNEVDQLMKMAEETDDSDIIIDLESQTVVVPNNDFQASFEINSFKKECLLAGVDETQYLINLKPEIEAFELIK
tara:strand:+ start:4462 stop:5037 length:576 start_codon:yes stop_codon:yes gene_type:complete